MVVPSYHKEEKSEKNKQKKEYERPISFGNSKRTNPHLIIQITSALKFMMQPRSYQNKNNACPGWSLSEEAQDSTD